MGYKNGDYRMKIIVKSGSKTYFGSCEYVPENDYLTLNNAVELVTTYGMTPDGGVRKNVVLTTIDYCYGVLDEISIRPDAVYKFRDMKTSDAEKLMQDYEKINNRDNLVQVPEKTPLVLK